jgi:WD40 repeat protein
MTNFSRLLAAGESGSPAVVPGKPEESYLIDQITVHDGKAEMPKKGEPLPAAEFDLIRQWIAEGAVDDREHGQSGPLYTQEHPPEYVQPPVITAMACSPDSKWLAISGFHEVLLVDTGNWQLSQRLVGLSERIEGLAFSPDSARLAVTGGSPGRMGEVQVWNVAEGKLLLSHQVTYDTLYGGAFSPDGKLIAFGCTDNTVRAIDSETGEQQLFQGAHEDWVRACTFTPDSSHLISAGRDMTCKLTEVATERFVDNITSITPGALRGGINALASHPQRNEILVGGADGVPKVYRVFRVTDRRIGDDSNLVRQFPAMPGRIFSVAVSPDGALLAAASTLNGASYVRIYKYNFDASIPDNVKAVMAKTSGERNAAENKLVDDYLVQGIEQVAALEVPEASLYSIAFHPTSSHLLVGGADGQVRVVDPASGQIAARFAPAPTQVAGDRQLLSARQAKNSSGLPLPTVVDRAAEQALLPDTKLVALEVEPQTVRFVRDSDYAQLVVTAVYADGRRVDVTRLAQYASDTPACSATASGFVRARDAGTGIIQVAFGDVTGQVACDASELAEAAHVDFVRDVNPVLSRLGCNQGTCHGAQKGKNGFKLSLRGYDPLEDVRALSDDLASRRLNTAAPDSSLMLLKPIGDVPHEGGVLLDRDSIYYHTLRAWIADGAKLDVDAVRVARIELSPQNPVIEREGAAQQFRVVAVYGDGSTRDVTREAFIESGNLEVAKAVAGGSVQALRRGEAPILARFEGAYAASTLTIMGNRDGFQWQTPEVYNTIDEHVARKWERMKILPSEVSNDAEFLRRVTLDLTGLPPKPEVVRAFLADPRDSRAKRAEMVESLIGSQDYVEHWANKWADLLQVNSKFLGKEGADSFRAWIRQQVDDNLPYDQFARQLVTSRGSNKDNPPAAYYKILRQPDAIMENTTHLFLGIRFNCNKCHDHPFERWTQDQYYELAAYFAHVGLKADPASGDRRIGGSAVEGATPLFEEIYDKEAGEVTHERTGSVVAPKFPFEFVSLAPPAAVADQAADAADAAASPAGEPAGASSPAGTRREQLADWLTSPDNPYFARSFVNRLWGYMTGTGLMEPLDDIRAGNPPTNPELLDYLTEEFKQSGFDVEHVLRLICNSRTYQLSVATHDWNADDTLNYSHAKARRLPAEVLYDAVHAVTGAVSKIPGVQPGTRAAALSDVAVNLPDGFLNNLGRPVRESACECERSQELQLGPVMALVSGPTVGLAISDPQCALPELAQRELTDEELIQEIYLRVLNRPATEPEVVTVLGTASQIDRDHEGLLQQLSEREAWWKDEHQRLETLRLEQLAAAEKAVADREVEMAPERERMEADRQARIAAAQTELDNYEKEAVTVATKYLSDRVDSRTWFPVDVRSMESSTQATMTRLPDRSIRVRGQKGKGTYTLVIHSPLKEIRGLRLEALPDPELEGKGPGFPGNGNFVLTELEVKAAPASDPQAVKAVKLVDGKADFSQAGFSPEAAANGQKSDQGGWAVHPQGGIPHWLTYRLAEPLGYDGGTILTIVLHQFHNAEEHRLAHFRISLSVDEGEVGLGLPEEFLALNSVPEPQRNPETFRDLLSYLQANETGWQAKKTQLAEAQKPLPADEKLTELNQRVAALKVPTPEDRLLVRLRTDVEASRSQLEQRRLTLAQDLTWALINSPAFLFNR